MVPRWAGDRIWDLSEGILARESSRSTMHLMASNGRYIRQLSDGRNARDLYQPDISPLGLAVSPTSNKVTIWGKLKKRRAPTVR